jgi:hypothetical protein
MSIEALTTTFTPASSCLGNTNIWLINLLEICPNSSPCPYYFLQGPPSTSDCLPQSYGGSEYSFYYPGICPSGYTSACTSIKSLGTYTVTVQICCPTRFVFLLPLLFRNYVYLSPAASNANTRGPYLIIFGNKLWAASVHSRQRKLFL